MMKLSEIREAYEELSGKLSEINRQLCFAGFAVLWIFNKTENDISIPRELYHPAFYFILSLSADILQYIYSALAWYIYYIRKRKKGKEDSNIEVNEPECLNIPAWILFIFKIGFLVVGYVLLGNFLYLNL